MTRGFVARWLPVFSVFLSAPAFAGGTTSATPAVIPQAPAIMRDVSMIQDSKYMYPYIPSFRTSADGRVAISAKELSGGYVQFYLFVPEALNSASPVPFSMTANPVPSGTPTPQANPLIMPIPAPSEVPDSWFAPPTVSFNGAKGIQAQQQHHTICDGTLPFSTPGAGTNPYPCGEGITCRIATI